MIAHDIKRIEETLKECSYLPIGGTAVGTGINTKKNFDKDIFRNNTGDLIEGYQEIVKRFEIKIES